MKKQFIVYSNQTRIDFAYKTFFSADLLKYQIKTDNIIPGQTLTGSIFEDWLSFILGFIEFYFWGFVLFYFGIH